MTYTKSDMDQFAHINALQLAGYAGLAADMLGKWKQGRKWQAELDAHEAAEKARDQQRKDEYCDRMMGRDGA